MNLCARALVDQHVRVLVGALVAASVAAVCANGPVQVLLAAAERPGAYDRCGNLALQIDAHLAMADAAGALQVLEVMHARFPRHERIDGAAEAVERAIDDTAANAGRIYRIARLVNALSPDASFVDLGGWRVERTLTFRRAARLFAARRRAGDLSPDEHVGITLHLARCCGFVADWEKAREWYEAAASERRGGAGVRDPAIVDLEHAFVYFELARAGSRPPLNDALTLLRRIEEALPPGTPRAWLCRYLTAAIALERGEPGDREAASIAVERLERETPDLDMRIVALRRRIANGE